MSKPSPEARWNCQNRDCAHVFQYDPGRYCPDCAGDVHFDYNSIPVATSVRPIGPIKGKRWTGDRAAVKPRYRRYWQRRRPEIAMCRWVCWNCGKGNDLETGGGGFLSRTRECGACHMQNRIPLRGLNGRP